MSVLQNSVVPMKNLNLNQLRDIVQREYDENNALISVYESEKMYDEVFDVGAKLYRLRVVLNWLDSVLDIKELIDSNFQS